MTRPVRVRFAPSPTGPLHIGGVRTALYNYLFARQQGGTMILRIEDTDQTRFVPGAEEYIRQSLAWCGIELDESPWHGGPHAPYRQSERQATYLAYARQLIERGQAYYAFDTPAELEAMRQQLLASKADHTGYGSPTRLQMKNSLSLPPAEVQARLAAGEPYSIRLLVPAEGEVAFDDLVRGHVRVQTHTIDDKVLLKSDGMPTYHLANVVDDHLMQISHVIRGEEWLPSAPLHVLLYRAFGWEATRPQFAHLPLLLKPEGEGKLSKRDGDRLGFSVFPLAWDGGAPAPAPEETGPDDEPAPQPTSRSSGFREDGYLPAALLNFLALLGWHPTTDQELLSLPDLVAQFDLHRIHKAGARFDIQKAKWFNQQYIKQLSNEELARQLAPELASRGLALPPAKVEAICGLMKERITFVSDIPAEGAFFFAPPAEYDAAVVAKKWNADLTGYLAALQAALATLPGLDEATARELTHQVAEQRGLKPGSLMQGLRVALTGAPGGPDLMGIMAVLGPAEAQQRLGLALETVKA
jgi:glutamyl-tRNA synthetase